MNLKEALEESRKTGNPIHRTSPIVGSYCWVMWKGLETTFLLTAEDLIATDWELLIDKTGDLVYGVWNHEKEEWCCVESGPSESDTPWRTTLERATHVQAFLAAAFPSYKFEVKLYQRKPQ